jgi:hypothetical protein
MRPFQVGDEVIRTGETKSYSNVIHGEKYTIKAIRGDGFIALVDRIFWWNPEFFTLVTKTTSGFKAFQQKLKKV